MDPHFSLELARQRNTLAARRHDLPAPIEAVMPVPWPASVGTLELNNALTRLRLDAGGLVIEEILRDYVDIVSTGAELYATWPQNDVVAYAGRRRLHVIDVSGPAPVALGYFLTGLLEEVVRGFSPLGMSGRRYLAILARPGDLGAPLRVVSLDYGGGQPRQLGEIAVATTNLVKVGWDHVLVYDAQALRVFDHALQPVAHPLVDALARLERPSIGEVEEIELLGDLPLAAISTDRGELWLVSWPDPLQPAAQLVARSREIMGLSQSPDAGWLRFSGFEIVREGEGVSTYAAQIRPERIGVVVRDEDGEERLALALDPPRCLTRPDGAGPVVSMAWIDRPTGLVACDRLGLDHWELR